MHGAGICMGMSSGVCHAPPEMIDDLSGRHIDCRLKAAREVKFGYDSDSEGLANALPLVLDWAHYPTLFCPKRGTDPLDRVSPKVANHNSEGVSPRFWAKPPLHEDSRK